MCSYILANKCNASLYPPPQPPPPPPQPPPQPEPPPSQPELPPSQPAVLPQPPALHPWAPLPPCPPRRWIALCAAKVPSPIRSSTPRKRITKPTFASPPEAQPPAISSTDPAAAAPPHRI